MVNGIQKCVHVCILEIHTNASHTDKYTEAVLMCTHTETLMASASDHYHAI